MQVTGVGLVQRMDVLDGEAAQGPVEGKVRCPPLHPHTRYSLCSCPLDSKSRLKNRKHVLPHVTHQSPRTFPKTSLPNLALRMSAGCALSRQ